MSSLVSALDRKTLVSGLRSEDHLKGIHEKTQEIVDYLKDTRGTHDGWACESSTG